MKKNLLALTIFGVAITATAFAQAPAPQGNPPMHGHGGHARDMDSLHITGSVTAIAADHYTLKDGTGTTYTVNFSANTRFVQQPVQHRHAEGEEPAPINNRPEQIKSTDIKVGDVIVTAGEIDNTNKTIGAIMVARLDPENLKRMQEMQTNYGKTWMAGKVTAINGTKITVLGMADQASHTIAVDEGTSFRSRGNAVTLADIAVDTQVRAEGSIKNGEFTATSVMVTESGRPYGHPIAPPDAPKN